MRENISLQEVQKERWRADAGLERKAEEGQDREKGGKGSQMHNSTYMKRSRKENGEHSDATI